VFTRNNVAKQSGVPSITWRNNQQSWCVQFFERDAKGKKTRRTSRKFPVKTSWAQASLRPRHL
jgi:hypothetical protein